MFVRLGTALPYLFIATFAASLLSVELIKANLKPGNKQAPSKTFSSFAKNSAARVKTHLFTKLKSRTLEKVANSLSSTPAVLPQLELVDIETFCFGNVDFLSLGSCSSTFLRCGQFSERRQYDFEECPLGEIFHNTRCRPAFEVKDCFNTEVNLLNDATEKLAQTTNFCARSPFESALYSSSQSMGLIKNARDKQCCVEILHPIGSEIRENLLHSFCEQNAQPTNQASAGGNFGMSMQTVETTSRTERCKNWYVTCHAPTIEIVFCDSGKIFDPTRHGCRRVQAEDQCPLIGVCKGWEWRTVPLGECKNNFLFCNAMRPTMFQCQVKGAIFKDGHCRAPEDQFYFCEKHKMTQNLHWQAYRCVHPRVFSPFVKECVLPNEYHCPNRIQCREGDSFATSCSDFFYCYEGKYLQSKCPHLTRWDQTQRRCISDESCHQFQDRRDDRSCQSGEAKPSVDCQSFEECGADGRWTTVSCKEYSTDRLKAPCRFCDKNFNPFDGQGMRQKQCVDGEKIVNKQDCDRYMECVDGEWFNLACPTDFFFDSNMYDRWCGLQGRKFNSDFSSVYLPPLYNQSHAQDNIGFGNGFGPTPKIPVNYKDKYTNSFEFCEKSSPSRLPNPYDCSKYKECAFDLASGQCRYDYQCVAPSVWKGFVSLRAVSVEKLGGAIKASGRMCVAKTYGFINGKCSSTISCDNANSQYSHGSGQCINQHTKAHYSQCSNIWSASTANLLRKLLQWRQIQFSDWPIEHNKKTKCSESSGKMLFVLMGMTATASTSALKETGFQNCAAGLAFSPSIGVCDWPRNVPGC
uniref:Chitin-binding type-2 domain-containing protein n=1 Tax=Ditylenchus dipsaci TaxID=166011 RepID=A0A915DFP0_9BILA